MTLICTVLAIVQNVLTLKSQSSSHGGDTSDGMGPLRVITFLGPLAVACGTAYTILSSRGRRSVGMLNAFPILVLFLLGFVGAGRQSMALGFVIYYVTCYAFRFRLQWPHFAAMAMMAYVAVFILFPYAVVARESGVRKLSGQAALNKSFELLLDIVGNPLRYQKQSLNKEAMLSHAAKRRFYYGAKSGWDRFSIIMPSDAIIDATHKEGTWGTKTIKPGYHMLLPRILDPDKPTTSTSNMLAHRVKGLTGNRDKATGITVGFISDCFSSYGWIGVITIPFIILLCLTFIYRTLFDDRIAFNVIPLAMVLNFPWLFSEAPITPQILSAFQGPVILLTVFGFIFWLVNLLIGVTARRGGGVPRTVRNDRLPDMIMREPVN
jgi:hypothetical protein